MEVTTCKIAIMIIMTDLRHVRFPFSRLYAQADRFCQE